MSFASFEDPEPGFQVEASCKPQPLDSEAIRSYPIVATSPQAWRKEEGARITPEVSDDDEISVPKTPQENETNQLEVFKAEFVTIKNGPTNIQGTGSIMENEYSRDEPNMEGYVSTADSVSTLQSTKLRYTNRHDVANRNNRFARGVKSNLVDRSSHQNMDKTLTATSEHTDDGLSVVLNSANHLLQAFLVLFKTNQTAFLATAGWHLIVGYSLAKTGATTLLTNTHLPFGADQLNPTTLLVTKFAGTMNLPWTFLALMGFRMKDLSSQKILLLTFALASLMQLRFHIKYLSNRQQWKYIFSSHNMSSATVALINLGCYVSSVRRSGRLL
ncbi:hypothetical protein K7432_005583 [Basidiobolus ranarum]|uniref:Uncharacterized protein n=1 Tax=Basidiobolus ranarum TaxID=34480 RepID=A0ABR2WWC3_9FUNG